MSDEIEKILKDLQIKSFHAGKLGSDRKFGNNREEAKQAIQAIINRSVAEARIDEIQHIMLTGNPVRTEEDETIIYYSVIEHRIRQLQATLTEQK